MGKLFGIIVTWHFSPKSDHSNERVYYKPVCKILKTFLNEESVSFLQPTTPETWEDFPEPVLDKKIKKGKHK